MTSIVVEAIKTAAKIYAERVIEGVRKNLAEMGIPERQEELDKLKMVSEKSYFVGAFEMAELLGSADREELKQDML
jgi:hypothetical protein